MEGCLPFPSFLPSYSPALELRPTFFCPYLPPFLQLIELSLRRAFTLPSPPLPPPLASPPPSLPP